MINDKKSRERKMSPCKMILPQEQLENVQIRHKTPNYFHQTKTKVAWQLDAWFPGQRCMTYLKFYVIFQLRHVKIKIC